jgi:FAD/FMN-containing dehydrogenase
MKNLRLATLDAGAKEIDAATLDALQGQLRGRLIDPDMPGYDESRTIWNAMIDRKPGLIVSCVGTADIVEAVRFVRDHGLLCAVRGGGHNIGGSALCDGGVVIDLSKMSSVRVDHAARRAWVEPGATLADLDRETQVFGLATPTGINSTTGVGGLTLGGGFGWISRKFGLTIDNLHCADVVTAAGEVVRASASENPELFWAMRGGGGNFGVVSGLEFQLHPLGPKMTAGLVVHPLDAAAGLLKDYRRLAESAPDELTCWVVMRRAPPLPFLPPQWHGREVLIFAMCYAGDAERAEKDMAALRGLGSSIADVVGPNPFVGWQAAFDPLLAPGARNYWKSHDFAELSDDSIALLVEAVRNLPGPECEIFIFHIGGAAGRIAASATAFPQRSTHFGMNVHARWRDPLQDAAHIDWAKRLFERAAPLAMGTAYVNFMAGDESERVAAAYGANYRRLTEIKRRYDPMNLFRMNQNVRPAAE